jgi:branched-chain amino acid transport system substrate-binding protein
LKVKQTNPKVVFIVDHTAEGAIVVKQAKELQLNAQFVADVSMVAKETLDGAGAAAEGMMGVRAASPTGPIWEKFKADFQAKYNTDPTIWSDFAYDTMMMVAKAIDLGGYTSDGIQQALFKVGDTYAGPSGTKKLNQYGIAIGVFEWVVVKDGAWAPYVKQ